jgi:hypothetical protein
VWTWEWTHCQEQPVPPTSSGRPRACANILILSAPRLQSSGFPLPLHHCVRPPAPTPSLHGRYWLPQQLWKSSGMTKAVNFSTTRG